MSRDLNHHRNRHARPEFPTPTACQPPQTPSSDRWTPDFAGALPHGPVFPAFAFRFDTDHGAVTFSGDTRRSENLIALARSSDLLIHEAVRMPPNSDLTAAALDHMLQSHVLVEDVGEIAQSANVPQLVLSHLVDFGGPIDPEEWQRLAKRGYDGDVTIGMDLMGIRLA